MPNQYLKPVIAVPSSLLITAITQSLPMMITVAIGNVTTEANTYIVGMAVRLFVPVSYGMYQANKLVGTITEINVNVFTLDLDSTTFDPFVIPFVTSEAPASISPNGSRNLQYNNATTRFAPFRSLNNIGN
jgi:hypothetical protein